MQSVCLRTSIFVVSLKLQVDRHTDSICVCHELISTYEAFRILSMSVHVDRQTDSICVCHELISTHEAGGILSISVQVYCLVSTLMNCLNAGLFLTEYRALLTKYRALLTGYTALLTKYRALVKIQCEKIQCYFNFCASPSTREYFDDCVVQVRY